MIKGSSSSGYTIVEVLIVLAVTAAILASVMLSISGQQRRTEFTQAVNDINSQIQDIANDITTGYYAKLTDFSCAAVGGRPSFGVSATDTQGTNQGCILIGRVMQFGVSGTGRAGFNTYNVVGVRQTGGHDVTNLTEAAPTAVPNNVQSQTLQYGLTVPKMYYVDGSGSHDIGAVAFMSSFLPIVGGNLTSGAPAVNVQPVVSSRLDRDQSSTMADISAMSDATPKNPSGGVVICFQSGGSDQHALITVGSNGRSLSTKLDIGSGACS